MLHLVINIALLAATIRGHAAINCSVIYPKLTGTAHSNREILGNARAVVQLLTENRPGGNSAKIETLLKALNPNSMDSIELVQRKVVNSTRQISRDDMEGTAPSFKRAVNLIKSWDTIYPSELVTKRVLGIFKALEDNELTNEEIRTLEGDIRQEHEAMIAAYRQSTEEGGENATRPGFIRRVDRGQRPTPINNRAAGGVAK